MTCNNCFLKNRISSLQSSLEEKAVLIEDPIDLYCLTGLTLSLGQLWISSKEALLLVDGRYIESAQKAPCKAELLKPGEIESFIQRNQVECIKFDGSKTTFERADLLQKTHPKCSFISNPFLTKELRLIKKSSEMR